MLKEFSIKHFKELLSTVSHIYGFSDLKPNWDSHNALPISDFTIEFALNFYFNYLIDKIKPSVISPVCDDGVFIEWCKQHYDIEIHLRVDKTVSILYDDRITGEEFDYEFDLKTQFDIEEIHKILSIIPVSS